MRILELWAQLYMLVKHKSFEFLSEVEQCSWLSECLLGDCSTHGEWQRRYDTKVEFNTDSKAERSAKSSTSGQKKNMKKKKLKQAKRRTQSSIRGTAKSFVGAGLLYGHKHCQRSKATEAVVGDGCRSPLHQSGGNSRLLTDISWVDNQRRMPWRLRIVSCSRCVSIQHESLLALHAIQTHSLCHLSVQDCGVSLVLWLWLERLGWRWIGKVGDRTRPLVINFLTPSCCHMGTAIKHPVPNRVKPSFVIFDIRALWLPALRGLSVCGTEVRIHFFLLCQSLFKSC